jgi:chromosome partitioning protein
MKIAILNQKGGVGKTTVSVNLAYGLAQAKKRTLLIDLDPQAHATVIYCADIPRDRTVKEVFERRNADLGELIAPAAVLGEPVDNLFIVPSNIHLAVTAERMISQHYREKRLHAQLEKLGADYDYTLLDCPPNLGVITVNAIYTADWILIPTTYGRYSLDGIADLFTSIEEIREGQGGAGFSAMPLTAAPARPTTILKSNSRTSARMCSKRSSAKARRSTRRRSAASRS